MEKRTEYLDEKLIAYAKSDIYPFHMPGHKRRVREEADPYAIDITEIDGFDNLHDAEEILAEAQQRAAALYDAKKSYYLINGSTCGILSAVSAATGRDGTILMARNCHKAVYHAAYLRNLKTRYLYPVITRFGIQGVITPESVEEALREDPGIQAVILTSPTYDGVVSDIGRIAEITHRYQILLIVDEAHGAHFGFDPYFPETAVRLGADLVIQSMHKTLPSMTQTALLHVCSDRIDTRVLERFLNIYETSSPSYVLMAGMDRCIRLLMEKGTELFAEYATQLKTFYQNVDKLHKIEVFRGWELPETECFRFDPSKLVISAAGCGLTGQQLYQILLEKYGLQMEMCSGEYVLAMTSFCDTGEGYERLFAALSEIEAESSTAFIDTSMDASVGGADLTGFISRVYKRNEKQSEIAQAVDLPGEEIDLVAAAGRIAGDYVYLYPPGIPLLVPGERIDAGTIANIRECQKKNLNIKGVLNDRINVVI